MRAATLPSFKEMFDTTASLERDMQQCPGNVTSVLLETAQGYQIVYGVSVLNAEGYADHVAPPRSGLTASLANETITEGIRDPNQADDRRVSGVVLD